MIPENIYKRERCEILQMFLDRDPIYYTEYFRNKYEQPARINLQREINSLS